MNMYSRDMVEKAHIFLIVIEPIELITHLYVIGVKFPVWTDELAPLKNLKAKTVASTARGLLASENMALF